VRPLAALAQWPPATVDATTSWFRVQSKGRSL